MNELDTEARAWLRAELLRLLREDDDVRHAIRTVTGQSYPLIPAPGEPPLDRDWIESLDALKRDAAHHMAEYFRGVEPAEYAWRFHEHLVSGALRIAISRAPAVKRPKINAVSLQVLRELIKWAACEEDGDVGTPTGPREWIRYERIARRVAGASIDHVRRAVTYLHDIGLIHVERRFTETERQAICDGKTGPHEPTGWVLWIDIHWNRLGGHPGPRPHAWRDGHREELARERLEGF